ncbi:MAG: leucine-rich repeat protein [Paludibacteraceae bacterium]|nr:leucine-rich repeat protein [Paludibacteraceae bacterium]
MKKIFTLFLGAFFALSASAAIYVSVPGIDFQQGFTTGGYYWQFYGEDVSYSVSVVYSAAEEKLEGTYDVADLDGEYTELVDKYVHHTITFESGTVEVTDEGDKYHVHCEIVGRDIQAESQNDYVIDIYYAKESSPATEPTDQDIANEVITLIDNIGNVVYTNACKRNIDAAREAYDALTGEQKELVSNYSTLTGAEAAYEAMTRAGNTIEWGESLLRGRSFSTANATTPLYVNNDNPFNYNMRLILYKGNWNGDESVWAANGGSDLQSVYMRLDNLDSSLIQIDMYYTYSVDIEYDPDDPWVYDEWTDNGDRLTWKGNQTSVYYHGNIRGLSRIVFTVFEKEVPAEVKNVINLIDAIGEVSYTDESKQKIDAAREAYDALTDEQKALVSNYSTLTDAETAYEALWGKHVLIDGLYYDLDRESQSARAAKYSVDGTYPSLPQLHLPDTVSFENEKYAVTSIAPLAFGFIGDLQEVVLPEGIDSIDNRAFALDSNLVTVTLPSTVKKIDYMGFYKCKSLQTLTCNALTPPTLGVNVFYEVDQPNATLYVPVSAVDAYKAADQWKEFGTITYHIPEEVAGVIDLIDAIGEVAYTDECKQKIDAAREAYDALTDEQKALVSNYSTLTDAEAAYANMKADHDAADAVIDLIDAIGEVSYSDASKDKIDAARKAYDALTDDQKALVTNYDVLIAAEERYAFLIPIELTVAGAEVQLAKFADGKTDAVVTKQGVLNGVAEGDSVTLTTTAAFSDAAAGEHKTITVNYAIKVVLAEKNYVLKAESATYSTEGAILEPMAADDEAQPETEEATVQNGIEVDGYGYCDGSSYSLKYHLKSGNPDQYKIDFADARFTNVAWTNLTTAGADGTIDIEVPVDIPTGDYTMNVTFRDSRYTFIESKPFTATIHVNLPETYVVVLFDNVMAVVDTCQCLTDIQWYHRNNSSEAWTPIDGATGYFYRQEGGLTGEYFIHAKVNGVDTYTCPQTDVKTLYGNQAQKAQVRISPNPVVSTAELTIEGADTFDHTGSPQASAVGCQHTLRIVNANGWEVELRRFEGNTTTIDMSACQVGNYMISVDGIVVNVIKK